MADQENTGLTEPRVTREQDEFSEERERLHRELSFAREQNAMLVATRSAVMSRLGAAMDMLSNAERLIAQIQEDGWYAELAKTGKDITEALRRIEALRDAHRAALLSPAEAGPQERP